MTDNPPDQRFIYPFGDQPFALNREDYEIDCLNYADTDVLAHSIREQWQDQGLVVLKNTGMQHLSELQRWGSHPVSRLCCL